MTITDHNARRGIAAIFAGAVLFCMGAAAQAQSNADLASVSFAHTNHFIHRTFDPAITEYFVLMQAFSSSNAIGITATAADTMALVAVDYGGSASVGFKATKTVPVTVTSMDGSVTKVYNFRFANAQHGFLQSVDITNADNTANYALRPEYLPTTKDYEVELPRDVTTIQVRGVTFPLTNLNTYSEFSLTRNGAAVPGFGKDAPGTVAVPLGETVRLRMVINPLAFTGGDTQAYEVVVRHADLPNPARLSSLQITDRFARRLALTPDFAEETTEYTAALSRSGEAMLQFRGISAAGALHNVEIRKYRALSGDAYDVAQTNLGDDTLSNPISAAANATTRFGIFSVGADAARTEREYFVNITTPPSSHAAVSSLTITGSDGNALLFNTAFDRSRFVDYLSAVPHTVDSVRFNAVAEGAGVTMAVEGASIDKTAITSGAESAPIALAEGVNTLLLTATAEDRTTTTIYRFTITREAVPTPPTPPTPPTLTSDAALKTAGISFNRMFSPAFSPGHAGPYTVHVTEGLSRFTGETRDPNATMELGDHAAPTGIGRAFLPLASNVESPVLAIKKNNSPRTLTAIVASSDGSATMTYTFHLTVVTGNVTALESVEVYSCVRQPPPNADKCDRSTISRVNAIITPDVSTWTSGTTNARIHVPNTGRSAHVFRAVPLHEFAGAVFFNGPVRGSIDWAVPATAEGGTSTPLDYPYTGGQRITVVVQAEDTLATETFIVNHSFEQTLHATLTLAPTAASSTKVYGTADPAVAYDATGLNPGDAVSNVFSVSPFVRAPGETAGEYPWALKDPLPFVSNTARLKYTVMLSPSAGNFTITPATLGYSSTNANKEYDGNDLPGFFISTITGIVDAEINGVVIADESQHKVRIYGCTFADKHVGDDKPVGGCALTGTSAANYTLNAAISGDIRKRSARISGVARSRVYDATLAAGSPIDDLSAVPPFIPGDDVSVQAGGVYADANAGENKQLIGAISFGGADSGNYELTSHDIIGIVTKRPLRAIAGGGGDDTPPDPADRSLLTIGAAEGEGLVGSDTAAQVFTGALELGARTPPSGAGTQPLLRGTIATNAAALPGKNYELAQFTDGVFTYSGARAAPAAPRNFAATNGPLRSDVSWEAPDPAPHPPLSEYRVRWRKTGAAAFSASDRGVSVAADAFEYAVTGLDAGAEYQIQVFAVNAEGDSPPASANATPRALSPDATLSAITASPAANFAILPAFDPAVTEYAGIFRHNGGNFGSLRLSATTNQSGARILLTLPDVPAGQAGKGFKVGSGNTNRVAISSGQELQVLDNNAVGARLYIAHPSVKYVFVVTSEDGNTTKSYTLNLLLSDGDGEAYDNFDEARAYSLEATDDANQPLTLDPVFADGGFHGEYAVEMRESASFKLRANAFFPVQHIEILTAAGDPEAETSVQTGLANGALSNAIAVADGVSVAAIARITSVAHNGATAVKDYRVTVERRDRSIDATLSAAELRDAGAAIDLVPSPFAPGTVSYAASVANEVENLALTPQATDAAAAGITVNGDAVASGAASAPIALSEGANTILVVVTAENAAFTATYTFTVTRRPPVIAVVITPAASGKTYGAAEPAAAYTAAGFADGDTAASVFSAPPFARKAGEDAGEYAYQLKSPLPFHDAASGLKYAFAFAPGSAFTIRPKTLSVSGFIRLSKEYDGTVNFAGSGVAYTSSIFIPGVGAVAGTTGGVGRDNLGLRVTGGEYASPALASQVALAALEFELLDNGSGANPANYQVLAYTATGTIARKQVTVTVTGATKQYDGTTDPPPGASGAFAPGDIAGGETVTVVLGMYDDKDAAEAGMISFTIAGADSGNYVATGTGMAAAVITPAPVAVGDVVLTKPYDGGFAFGASSVQSGSGVVSGAVGNDSLTLTAVDDAATAYAQSEIHSGGTVTGAVFALAGAGGTDARNYMLPPAFTVTGVITRRPVEITVSAGTNSKEYDGKTAAPPGITAVFVSGRNVVAAERGAVSVVFGDYDSKNAAEAGMISVMLGGAKAGNYMLVADNVPATITPKPVEVAAVRMTREYDGSAALQGNVEIRGGAVSGALDGDSLMLRYSFDSADRYVSADAGDNIGLALSGGFNLVATGGADARNYMLPDIAPTGVITPKTVMVSAVTLADKIYNSETDFTGSAASLQSGGEVSGEIGIQALTMSIAEEGSRANAVYASEDAGTGITVTGMAFAPASANTETNAANYALPVVAVSGNIIARPVVVEIQGTASKEYDGGIGAPSGIAGVYAAGSGTVPGDDVAIVIGDYNSKNAAEAGTLAVSLSGSDARNYTVNAGVAAAITVKSVTIGAATLEKEYNGNMMTVGASFSGGAVDGAVGGESLTLQYTADSGAYDSANVGGNIAISGAEFALDAGADTDAANYMLPGVIAVSGVITRKPVTAADVMLTKTYDGTANFGASSVSGGEITGEISGQNLELQVTGGVYPGKIVGENLAITSPVFSLVSDDRTADPANYAPPDSITATGTITKFATTYTLSIAARVYDATNVIRTAVSGGFSPLLFGGDAVTISTTVALYADANAGAAKSIIGAAAGGGDLGNYEVTITGSGEITKRVLRLTAAGTGQDPPSAAARGNHSLLRDNSVSASGEGLVSTHTLAQVLMGSIALGTREPPSGAGSAPIVRSSLAPKTAAPGKNYQVAFTDGVFTFLAPNTQNLIITPVSPLTRVYGELAPASFSHTIRLPEGGAFFGNDNVRTDFFGGKNVLMVAGSDVGTHAFSLVSPLPASAAVMASYIFSVDADVQYTITPKTVMVARVTLTKPYDTTNAVTGAALGGGAVSDTAADESLTLALAGVVDDVYASVDAGTGIAVTTVGAQDFVLQRGNSATNPSNYALPAGIEVTGVITPFEVEVADVVLTKTYDGSDAFGASGVKSGSGEVTGELGGQALKLTASAATYSDAAAGGGKTITSPAFGLAAAAGGGGANPANYALPSLSDITVTGEITAKQVSAATLRGASKQYDGGAGAPPGIAADVGGVVSGDETKVRIVFGDYNSATVAGAASIGISLDGEAKDNYELAGTSVAARITRKVVSVSAVTLTKPYNSTVLTADAALGGGTITGAADDESLMLMHAANSGTYTSKNAATGIAIDGARFNLVAGPSTDAANYMLPDIALTGVITPLAVQVAAVTLTKTYDGGRAFGDSSIQSGGKVTGAFSGEALTLALRGEGVYGSADVGAVTFSAADAQTAFALSGVSATNPVNYELPGEIQASGVITRKMVTAQAGALSKMYDGTLTAPPGAAAAFAAEDIVSVDAGEVAVDIGEYDHKDAASAASIAVSLSGEKAGNYELRDAGITARITPRLVSVAAVLLTKIYDTNNAAAGAAVSGGGVTGQVSGEVLTLEVTRRGAYNSAAAGNGIGITGAEFALVAGAGADLANYQAPQQISISGVIERKMITATATGGNEKVYDGALASPVGIAAAFAAGDIESADEGDENIIRIVFGDYDSADVADAETVDIRLEGTSAGNYALTAATIAASITKRDLRVSVGNVVVASEAARPAPADIPLRVAADVEDEGYAPGEGAAEAFTGTLTYGTPDSDGREPIERGDLAATDNYEIASFTGGVLVLGIIFDADGSAGADATDGVLIVRYLLGLRGDALIAGLADDLKTGEDADSIAATLKAAVEATGSKYDVDRSGGGANAADGIMIARYLLGVTEGAGLTAGQTDVAHETVAKNIADTLP